MPMKAKWSVLEPKTSLTSLRPRKSSWCSQLQQRFLWPYYFCTHYWLPLICAGNYSSHSMIFCLHFTENYLFGLRWSRICSDVNFGEIFCDEKSVKVSVKVWRLDTVILWLALRDVAAVLTEREKRTSLSFMDVVTTPDHAWIGVRCYM